MKTIIVYTSICLSIFLATAVICGFLATAVLSARYWLGDYVSASFLPVETDMPPTSETSIANSIRTYYQAEGWAVEEVVMRNMDHRTLKGYVKIRKMFTKEGGRLVPFNQDLKMTLSCTADQTEDGDWIWQCR